MEKEQFVLPLRCFQKWQVLLAFHLRINIHQRGSMTARGKTKRRVVAFKKEGAVCLKLHFTTTTTTPPLSRPFIVVPGLQRLRAPASQRLFHGDYAAAPWGVFNGSLSHLQNPPLPKWLPAWCHHRRGHLRELCWKGWELSSMSTVVPITQSQSVSLMDSTRLWSDLHLIVEQTGELFGSLFNFSQSKPGLLLVMLMYYTNCFLTVSKISTKSKKTKDKV